MFKIKFVIDMAFAVVCIVILAIIPISYGENRFTIDGEYFSSITATRYGHFGFFNDYDSVKFILRNKDGSIIQIKIFNTGELINIDEVIDRQNSLVNFNDNAVIIKDLWGNVVEWNLSDVSSKLVKLR